MRKKEIKIAIVAILSVVIIYVGIVFLKGLKLMSTDNVYYVEMANVAGLSRGGEVVANGMNIGIVKDITYDAQKQLLDVAMELNEGFCLPRGSRATITKEMLGSPKLNIVLGSNPNELLAQGDTISGSAGGDLMEMATDMLPQVEAVVPKLDSILTALNQLVYDPALAASLHNMEYISENLKTTTDDVNHLLAYDMPSLLNNANTICTNLAETTTSLKRIDIEGIASTASQTMATANQTMHDLHLFTNQLNNPNSSIGRMMNDPGLYNNLDSTMLNASRLLEDLRMHPKRYVHFSLFGKSAK